MSAYDYLANIYDDYQGFDENKLAHEWANFIEAVYMKHVVLNNDDETGIYALDLGCGTGQVTWSLAKRSWHTYGIDNSPAMLNIAWNYEDDSEYDSEYGHEDDSEYGSEGGSEDDSEYGSGDDSEYGSEDEDFVRPAFLLQDMTDFDLGFELDIIYTSLDSYNHLDAESLQLSLQRSYESLRPGGMLLFDLHAESYFLEFLDGQEYHDISNDYAIYWSSVYDEETQRNIASIDVFEAINAEETRNLYERNSVEIIEYFHEAKTVVKYLENLGFSARILTENDNEFIDAWDGQRIFILAIK